MPYLYFYVPCFGHVIVSSFLYLSFFLKLLYGNKYSQPFEVPWCVVCFLPIDVGKEYFLTSFPHLKENDKPDSYDDYFSILIYKITLDWKSLDGVTGVTEYLL